MATNKNAVKPGKNGYKIIFNENTVVMNYKFAAAAAEYGTREYKIMVSVFQNIMTRCIWTATRPMRFSMLPARKCIVSIKSGRQRSSVPGKNLSFPHLISKAQ